MITECLLLESEDEAVLTPLQYTKILDIQHTIFELLTVGKNEQEVFSTLCQMAEKLLPNSVSSVMLLNLQTGLMDVVCAPSIPQAGHDVLTALKPGLGGGSCGNAVFQNEAQYVKDTKSDPRWTDIRQIAYDFNLCSCWSMPIRNSEKKAIGSFALSSFEHRSPSAFHKRLLENCAFIVNIVLKRSEYERQIQESEKKLRDLAFYDQLTNLPNRQKIILDIIENSPTACAILNIDNFQEINDFFGLAAGDEILRQVSQWFPYRLGGDEFAIIFYDDTPLDVILCRINALLALLEEKVFTIGEETINIRMTAGVALGSQNLLTRADIALHRAKEKNTHLSIYELEENIEEKYRNNMTIARNIRQALSENRIICHYQPIVNVITGVIDKYETLVRMIDNDCTIILPMQFLPIAKKTKLYPQITRAVIHQACAKFETRSESFSINLSDSDIRDPHTVSEIINIITQTKTAPRIIFEILESEGINNYEEVASFIERVKALGAKIAIDDFGTGYSNFENILKLNVDFIKIDGSLIKGITTDSRHNIIVDSIVDFSKKIGAKTIAEFVSDEAIYDAIVTHGIDYSQGYYTGKPQPLN